MAFGCRSPPPTRAFTCVGASAESARSTRQRPCACAGHSRPGGKTAQGSASGKRSVPQNRDDGSVRKFGAITHCETIANPKSALTASRTPSIKVAAYDEQGQG